MSSYRKRPSNQSVSGPQWPASMFSGPGPGSSTSNLGPTGIGPSGGVESEYTNPGESRSSPFSRDGKTVAGITTQRQRGFQIVDINPFTVPKTVFPCLVPPFVLQELFGAEVGADFSNTASGTTRGWNTALDFLGYNAGESNANNILPPAGPPQDFSPFWRTVEIPVTGTWLLVEFLPARINDESVYAQNFAQGTATPPAPQNTTPSQHSLYGPICKTSGNVVNGNPTGSSNCIALNAGTNKYVWNDNLPADNLIDEDFTTKNSSNDCILIQFEDATIAPLIAQPGTKYKLPFTRVFVTFKIRNPRIRLTIGNNAELERADDNKPINATLHMAPGRGILDHSILHPVPFCLDNNNVIGATGQSVAGGGNVSTILIQNSKVIAGFVGAGAIPDGVNVGWLTGVQFTAFNQGAGVSTYIIGLSIIRTNARNGTSSIKRLHTTQGTVPSIAGSGSDIHTLDFSVPIRFVLKNGDVLRLDLSTISASQIFYQYSIRGYTMGALQSGVRLSGPYRIMGNYTEHPYPQDDWTGWGPV